MLPWRTFAWSMPFLSPRALGVVAECRTTSFVCRTVIRRSRKNKCAALYFWRVCFGAGKKRVFGLFSDKICPLIGFIQVLWPSFDACNGRVCHYFSKGGHLRSYILHTRKLFLEETNKATRLTSPLQYILKY